MKVYPIIIYTKDKATTTIDVFLTKRGAAKEIDRIEADLSERTKRFRADRLTLACEEDGVWWTIGVGEAFLHL